MWKPYVLAALIFAVGCSPIAPHETLIEKENRLDLEVWNKQRVLNMKDFRKLSLIWANNRSTVSKDLTLSHIKASIEHLAELQGLKKPSVNAEMFAQLQQDAKEDLDELIDVGMMITNHEDRGSNNYPSASSNYPSPSSSRSLNDPYVQQLQSMRPAR